MTVLLRFPPPRRHSYRLLPVLAALGLLAAVAGFFAADLFGQGQTYQGSIDRDGFHLTSPTWATWCRTSCRSFLINDGVPWDGQDGEAKLARYMGGDATVNGWTAYPGVNVEHQGGEIMAAMIELYRRAGVNRTPTMRELWDFAFANPCGSYLCGCGYYEGITGSPHPITPGCGQPTPRPRPTPRPTPFPVPPEPTPAPTPSGEEPAPGPFTCPAGEACRPPVSTVPCWSLLSPRARQTLRTAPTWTLVPKRKQWHREVADEVARLRCAP